MPQGHHHNEYHLSWLSVSTVVILTTIVTKFEHAHSFSRSTLSSNDLRIQHQHHHQSSPTRSQYRHFTTTTSLKNANDFKYASRLDGLDAPTVWHEFSPLAQEFDAINLGQGFPDWNPPAFCLEAISEATIQRNANQYARSYAHLPLAQRLAEDYSQNWNRVIDPITEIATASGVTNVLYCALQGLIDQGDEVLLLEPAFDIYSSQVKMARGTCVYCPLRPNLASTGTASDVFTLGMDELESKITDKTKILILNTPHNPTGKMFSLEELRAIAQIVLKHPNLIVISDEVYEHIVFDTQNEPHLSIASIDDGVLWDRTITMSSAGKTFSCTGWKVGWAVGPAHLIKAVSAIQQWVNFSSATPTQDAVALALQQAKEPFLGFDMYYDWLASEYKRKRELLTKALQSAGMTSITPPGGFFIMADTSQIDFPYKEIAKQPSEAMPTTSTNTMMPRDWALSRWLTQEVGVTAIPPSAFYSESNLHLAKDTLRFAFCKGDDTILEAERRLKAYFS